MNHAFNIRQRKWDGFHFVIREKINGKQHLYAA